MGIIETIKQDYENFPDFQSYEIYADNVSFADPLTRFEGIARYQKMINFLGSFFSDINLELHEIEQHGQLITTQWTLVMVSPLPWKPVLRISGSSELMLNNDLLIESHTDSWNIAPWQVLMQNFRFNS